MRWPTMKDVKDLEDDDIMKNVTILLGRCITEIHDGDTIHNRIDINEDELDVFIDSMPTDSFEHIGFFFNSMPKLLHVVNVKNPKTKKESEIVIQGLENFFG